MGYKVPPPAPADRVAWPDDFGQRFVVCVDTEEEFDWSAPLSPANRATSAAAAIPDAHRRFADHGVPLTFLIDHPIATDGRAIDILRAVTADGRSEVGAQLHAWVNPPHEEALTAANSFVGNLSPELEAAKLDVLTAAITEAFGAPSIYRAGRYGIGPNTLGLLARRGYRFDSSMRSGYDYSDEGGPDFAAIGNDAFRCGPGDALVELPLTTIHTGLVRRLGAPLHRMLGKVPKGRGLFARTGLLARVALTPEEMPLADALEAVRVAAGDGLRVLNFSFHSPSLVPGHTPYVRDATDLARFYAWWDAILAELARLKIAPASFGDLRAALTPAPAVR
ncbi:hypothetical protein BH09PSE4_BH09PSE4_18860 [soil metagenome]